MSISGNLIHDDDSTGHILNDNYTEVDHLGDGSYAEALAETIESVNPPITIGVYGRWGSGKTSLIKHVRKILQNTESQRRQAEANEGFTPGCKKVFCIIGIILFSLAFVALITSVGLLIFDAVQHKHVEIEVKKTATPNHHATAGDTRSFRTIDQTLLSAKTKDKNVLAKKGNLPLIVTVVVASVITLLIFPVQFNQDPSPPSNINVWSNVKILLMAAFAKLPFCHPGACDSFALRNKSDLKSSVKGATSRYMFVKFNAWSSTGTDNLWAGIALALASAAEAEFGKITTRVSRMCQIEKVSDQTFASEEENNGFFAKLGPDKEKVGWLVKGVENVVGFQSYAKWFQQQPKLKNRPATVLSTSNWWFLYFTTDVEALFANDNFEKLGVKTSLEDPFYKPNLDLDESLTLIENEKSTKKPNDLFALLRKSPKTACGVPLVFWYGVIVLALAMPVVVIAYVETVAGETHIVAKICAWIPGVLAIAYLVVWFFYAMFHSQSSRINAALQGTKGYLKAELGAMNKIKVEIDHITNLVHCSEYTDNVNYKFIILIDDLDRIQLPLVKSILDAVFVLLSSKYSPFICMIAVNSHTATESIMQTLQMSSAEASGRSLQYLRKIVNLPFCVPVPKNKRYYIGGLMDQSGMTNEFFISHKPDPPAEHQVVDRSLTTTTSGTSGNQLDVELDSDQFLLECRNIFLTDRVIEENLEDNPRLIKRIFNVITLTAIVVNRIQERQSRRAYIESMVSGQQTTAHKAIRTRKFAKDLVRWLTLTEQWPFRMSYIMELLTKSAQTKTHNPFSPNVLNSDDSLFYVYKKFVQPSLTALGLLPQATSDCSIELLHGFLSEMEKDPITVEIAYNLVPYTVNIDYSLVYSIGAQIQVSLSNDISKEV